MTVSPMHDYLARIRAFKSLFFDADQTLWLKPRLKQGTNSLYLHVGSTHNASVKKIGMEWVKASIIGLLTSSPVAPMPELKPVLSTARETKPR